MEDAAPTADDNPHKLYRAPAEKTECDSLPQGDLDLDAPLMSNRDAIRKALVLIHCFHPDPVSRTCKQRNKENQRDAIDLLARVLGIKK